MHKKNWEKTISGKEENVGLYRGKRCVTILLADINSNPSHGMKAKYR